MYLAKFHVDDGADIGHFVGEKVQVIPDIVDTHTIITSRAFRAAAADRRGTAEPKSGKPTLRVSGHGRTYTCSIGLDPVALRGERRAGAAPHDPALLDHHVPVGQRHQRRQVLVDDEDRLALGLERAHAGPDASRISGASPSVASSRITRRGLVISARPIASICCSPPDSWLPAIAPPLRKPREQAEDALQRPPGRAEAGGRGGDEVFLDAQRREYLPGPPAPARIPACATR